MADASIYITFNGDQPYRCTLSGTNVILLPGETSVYPDNKDFRNNAHLHKMNRDGVIDVSSSAPGGVNVVSDGFHINGF